MLSDASLVLVRDPVSSGVPLRASGGISLVFASVDVRMFANGKKGNLGAKVCLGMIEH